MFLQLSIEFPWLHTPGLFGEFSNEGIQEHSICGEDFNKAKFALVVKEKSAIRKGNYDASLTIREAREKILARMTSGIARIISGIKNQLTGHTQVDHQGTAPGEVDDEGLAKTANALDSTANHSSSVANE